ncbi:DsbA family oxidoreductase [Nocardiopsis dassonvillei]|uniref:DsbA family oxidoreductase n=1 Tax=Nocardiopsis dassonvillei TaxID=2014 RepID=UPI0008FC9AB1|nr:DsbA family oxidoreductase [Nocardiopsis dassonvillei]APC37397.1 disulfide bond formation protein DsbA [Nocardiopsis dassonvillei]MCP3014384.1 DsbA family oxidoreductase [Nocardiopsis dassonvillei]
MRIEIWADTVCPWTYIGKRRLERALAGLDDALREEVEVVWRPYRIDPAAPAVAEPLEPLLRDPLVDTALRACAPDLTPARNRVRVAEVAAAEGLGPRWGAAWRVSSHDSHRLLALALEVGGPGLQDAAAEGVLRAHFTVAEDIGSADVLDRVAREAGFPDGGRLLAAGAGEEAVRELLLRGRAVGVRTSPTLVVDGRALEGAQHPDAIRDFLAGASGRAPRRLPEEVERFRQAESLLERGDPLGALTLLRPMLDEHAADRNVRLLAARAYYRSAQLGRARRTLEVLVARSPDDAYARLLLGRTLQRQGERGLAEPHLRLAGAMVPGYV